MRLQQLINKLNAFDFKAEQEQVVAKNKNVLVELQQQQLLEGRDVNGNLLKPFYSEDAYFKTKDAALRYAKWKQFINPKGQSILSLNGVTIVKPTALRPLDVPNLYITGQYHQSLQANVNAEQFSIKGTSNIANKIEASHPDALGLNEKSREEFGQAVVIPGIEKALKQKVFY